MADGPVTLTLFETSADSGEFLSESLLLVSPDLPAGDQPDDDETVWSDNAGAFVPDDATDDRTHRATIDGTVRVVSISGGQTLSREAPVSQRQPVDARKTLNIRIRIYKEPYLDTGYMKVTNDPSAPGPVGVLVGAGNGLFDYQDDNGNGVHDASEPSEPYLDFSGGVVVNTDLDNGGKPLEDWYARGDEAPNDVGDGRGPVASTQQVLDQVERATIAWAQAGIEVVMIGNPIVEEAPVGADGFNILSDGWVHTSTLDQVNHPSDDQVAILSVSDAAADVVEVIFSGPMTSDGVHFTATGYARVPANQGITLESPLGENTYLFVAPSVDITRRTLAHEIGHALTNTPDSESPDYIYFPFIRPPPTGGDASPTTRRRISHSTEGSARTVRPLGCLTCQGNTLLIIQSE